MMNYTTTVSKAKSGGVRRYQNPDGTLTPEGRRRYEQLDSELKELKSYAKNPSGLGKSRMSTAIRNRQIQSLEKQKNALNQRTEVKKRYGNSDRKLTDYQHQQYRIEYGKSSADRIAKDYSKGKSKKEAVEAEKKRIARGKKISMAVGSLMYADFASGYKISGAAKKASKAVIKKVLSDMMAKNQYRQETKDRYYVPFAEI